MGVRVLFRPESLEIVPWLLLPHNTVHKAWIPILNPFNTAPAWRLLDFTVNMMTSSNGSIFRVTAPFCGKFTGHQWIPHTKASDAELWCFLWSAPEQTTEKTIARLLTWDAISLTMTSAYSKYDTCPSNDWCCWLSWRRHRMETFSALLAICAGNLPVPGEFLAQRPVAWSYDVFFDLRLNKRLSKQSRGWWFETLPRPLWRHSNVAIGWSKQRLGNHQLLRIYVKANTVVCRYSAVQYDMILRRWYTSLQWLGQNPNQESEIINCIP